jgi:hypothetical protein
MIARIRWGMNPTLKTSYIIAPSPPITTLSMVYHNLRREEGFKDKKLKEFSFGNTACCIIKGKIFIDQPMHDTRGR